MMTNNDQNEEDFALGLGCSLYKFMDLDALMSLIKESQSDDVISSSSSSTDLERIAQEFRKIVNYYCEQPHLLDPHLQDPLISTFVDIILRNEDNDIKVGNGATLFVHLIQTRGPKYIPKFFPHSVNHLPFIIKYINKEKVEDVDKWCSQYVFLLWLSILVLIPFHLSRFDEDQDQDGNSSIMENIYSIICSYLKSTTKCQDAAAIVASKFLTRPDIGPKYLERFVEHSLEIIENKGRSFLDTNDKIGALKGLAAIYKVGRRQDLISFAQKILKVLSDDQGIKTSDNSLIRKLVLKCVQRIGLTYLMDKINSWRYQRGNRSLIINLTHDKTHDEESQKEKKLDDLVNDVEEDEEYDIPDEIEEIIEELLNGLRDKETIIRWSAAKGIGRITNRLPKDLADEVVGSLLELFTLRETDSAWHGGCLALAELSRRGLLLPNRFPVVIPAILKALVYDEKKGCYSVGSHIRDAACYVCWAFARAYEPGVLKPWVTQIANALVVVTVFDREVNCRRAASAAFQENVGRQGTFPHGIDILQKTDYFIVGNRTVTFTEIAPWIAYSFSEYSHTLIMHLVEKKIGHWDINIRELTSKSLKNLTTTSPDIMINDVLPLLLNNVERGTDLYLKHGSILAIGEIVAGLTNSDSSSSKLNSTLSEKIHNIAVDLVTKSSLQKTGNELLRQAMATFIDNVSSSKFKSPSPIVDLWQSILEENIAHLDPLVQSKSISALPNFLEAYFTDQDGNINNEKRDGLINEYIKILSNPSTSENTQRGFCLAMGSLPIKILHGKVDLVLQILIKCSQLTGPTEKWAEGRRDALKSLISVVKTLGMSPNGRADETICESNVAVLYECFLKGLEDYTTERRGDIGAWVREAAMSGLYLLITLGSDFGIVPENCVQASMPGLAQQAVEKIDRTRAHAGSIFVKILWNDKVVGIPDRDEIRDIFPSLEKCELSSWTQETYTFPLFVKVMFKCPEYLSSIITGLIVSIGGITLSLVKHASNSLFEELKTYSDNSTVIGNFIDAWLEVFEKNTKNDRITIPFFNMTDSLLTSGLVSSVMNSERSIKLFSLTKGEINRCGDPNKLMGSINVFCALLEFNHENLRKKCLVQLSIFMCHKFPRIRKVSATKLYETLIAYDEIVPEDKLDDVMNILSDTKWDQKGVEELRPVRNSLCELLSIPPPAVIKKPI